jgi:phenylpropionate dioxygenase-like ring-hydroxylating dioxygenase large terminal subunit
LYPFKDGAFAVRDGWYVAAWSHEVGRDLMERWIVGEPVVLFRRQDGTAAALSGRCPHRHYPLAAGVLKGDELTCGYHGIVFGADGRCLRVPSQDRAPARYGVRAYPLVERWKWLWIWMGDPALADEALIPDHAAIGLDDTAPLGQGRVAEPINYALVKGRYQLLNDNLLDLSHLSYLHAGNIGMGEIAQTLDDVTFGETWVRSHRLVKDAAPPKLRQPALDDGVRLDRLIDFTFHLPGLHVGLERSSIAISDPDRPGEAISDSIVYHAVTPGTADTTHYFFAMAVHETDTPGGAARRFEAVRRSIGAVLDEDIFATEQIERMITALDPPPRDMMVRSDAAVVRGRAMLQAAMDAETARAAS